MVIPDPDFLSSWILDPGSEIQQEPVRDGPIFIFSHLFCSHKFHKIEKYFIFKEGTNNLSQLSKRLSIFNPKNCY
jgi:hypothetical protein